MLDFHHLHLYVPDRDAARDWYLNHLSGTLLFSNERSHHLDFGGSYLLIAQREAPPAGSAVSTIDSIAFSFADLEDKLEELLAVGATVLSPLRRPDEGLARATIEDPWGVKIVLVDDAEARGAHHVRLLAPDPREMAEWYAERMGGVAEPFTGWGGEDSIRYGSFRLVFGASSSPLAPTAGRTVDHIGWWIGDLERGAEKLRGQGVRFTMEPKDFFTTRIAFFEAAGGVRAELVQDPRRPSLEDSR